LAAKRKDDAEAIESTETSIRAKVAGMCFEHLSLLLSHLWFHLCFPLHCVFDSPHDCLMYESLLLLLEKIQDINSDFTSQFNLGFGNLLVSNPRSCHLAPLAATAQSFAAHRN